MSHQYTIRNACLDDLEWIIQQLKKFSQFFGSKKPLFNDQYASDGLTNLINNHVFLVCEKSGDGLVGLISGIVTPHSFNPEIKVLAEAFWWIDEAHRGSRAALLLLNEFTKIGKNIADWVIFTLEDQSPVNDRCLTNRGYKFKEKNYILEVC